jgi:hypothetical protein
MIFEDKKDEIAWGFFCLNNLLTSLLENLTAFTEERKEFVAQLQDAKERLEQGINDLNTNNHI